MTNSITTVLSIGEKEIDFPAPIKETLELDGLCIVRVYPDDYELHDYPQEKLNRNVYACNLDGELVWQIQDAPHGGEETDKAYMNIWIEKGKLIAGNWVGIDYRVNLRNGFVEDYRKGVGPW